MLNTICKLYSTVLQAAQKVEFDSPVDGFPGENGVCVSSGREKITQKITGVGDGGARDGAVHISGRQVHGPLP